jgi:hypothetical protein
MKKLLIVLAIAIVVAVISMNPNLATLLTEYVPPIVLPF